MKAKKLIINLMKVRNIQELCLENVNSTCLINHWSGILVIVNTLQISDLH